MRRLRLVAVQVLPQFVVDDGENVVPAPPIQPIMVSSADWPRVIEFLEKSRVDLENDLNEPVATGELSPGG